MLGIEYDRENIPGWTEIDESEAQRVFRKAFVTGYMPTTEEKLDVMRASRFIVSTAKEAKVGIYAG